MNLIDKIDFNTGLRPNESMWFVSDLHALDRGPCDDFAPWYDKFRQFANHTNGNVIVMFRNQDAIATGDFFFNTAFPYIDYRAGCDTKNWIEQIKILAEKKYQYIIPGHFSLATNEQLLKQGEYLTDLRAAVQSKIDESKSLEEIQEEIKMEKYADFGFQRILKGNIKAVYRELTEGNQ